MRRCSTLWTMPAQAGPLAIRLQQRQAALIAWATKHPLKRAERLSNLRAPRTTRLPKLTIEEYEIQTRKLSL